MDFHQSENWGKFLESLGWQTEVVEGCALRIRKLGPLGSIIKIQRPDFLPIEKIDAAAKKYRALFVKIEPINESQNSELITQNYRLDSWPLTATRTLEIDLNQSEEFILKGFSKDVRQTLKKLGLIGLDPKGSKPLESIVVNFDKFDDGREIVLKEFYRMWKETGTRGKFWVPPYKELLTEVEAFGQNSLLILTSRTAENDQNTEIRPEKALDQHPTPGVGTDNHGLETTTFVASCLLLFFDDVAYYHHAGSTVEGQKLEAPYLVMWQAILESKSRGMKKLDLEGIFDPRFKEMFKKWLGFSVFKLKWGGQVVEYPGSFVKVYNPFVGILFKLEKLFKNEK